MVSFVWEVGTYVCLCVCPQANNKSLCTCLPQGNSKLHVYLWINDVTAYAISNSVVALTTPFVCVCRGVAVLLTMVRQNCFQKRKA